MDKIYDITRYINTIKINNDFFQNFYYHSLIDLNLIKLESILKYGILSKKLIESNKLSTIYTHQSSDFDSKNGDDYVSLTKYTDKMIFNPMFESFPLHTMTSVSLLVDKYINISSVGVRQSYFDDEVFCFNKVESSNIKGIILPEHLSNLSISEVNCLPNDLSCFTKRYLSNWLKCIEKYFNNSIPSLYIDELKISYEQLWDIIEEYESPEKWIQQAIKTQRRMYGKDIKDTLGQILQYCWEERFKKEDPKYLELITKLNKQKLPIYEIKEKCLRKIN